MAGLRDNLRVGMDITKYKQRAYPKLIKRVWFFGNVPKNTPNLAVVPDGATFAIGRVVGCGGSISQFAPADAVSGGGGAYSRRIFKVKAGETLTVYAGNSLVGFGNSVIYQRNRLNALQTVISADAGGTGTSGAGGVVSHGAGAGSNSSTADFSRQGSNGALGLGGAPGSDAEDPFGLNITGVGANGNTGKWATNGGGATSRYGVNYSRAGMGVICIDYYDADPRIK